MVAVDLLKNLFLVQLIDGVGRLMMCVEGIPIVEQHRHSVNPYHPNEGMSSKIHPPEPDFGHFTPPPKFQMGRGEIQPVHIRTQGNYNEENNHHNNNFLRDHRDYPAKNIPSPNPYLRQDQEPLHSQLHRDSRQVNEFRGREPLNTRKYDHVPNQDFHPHVTRGNPRNNDRVDHPQRLQQYNPQYQPQQNPQGRIVRNEMPQTHPVNSNYGRDRAVYQNHRELGIQSRDHICLHGMCRPLPENSDNVPEGGQRFGSYDTTAISTHVQKAITLAQGIPGQHPVRISGENFAGGFQEPNKRRNLFQEPQQMHFYPDPRKNVFNDPSKMNRDSVKERNSYHSGQRKLYQDPQELHLAEEAKKFNLYEDPRKSNVQEDPRKSNLYEDPSNIPAGFHGAKEEIMSSPTNPPRGGGMLSQRNLLENNQFGEDMMKETMKKPQKQHADCLNSQGSSPGNFPSTDHQQSGRKSGKGNPDDLQIELDVSEADDTDETTLESDDDNCSSFSS